MRRPSLCHVLVWFLLACPLFAGDCNKLGLGCSCEGSMLLPAPPALQCSLCWEQPPPCPRYRVAARLASSSIVLQRGASAPPVSSFRPRGGLLVGKRGLCLELVRNSPGLGVQLASPCFSQRLWALARTVWRGCAEQLFLKETGFPPAGPSPPFASRWPPSVLLSRGRGISISRKGCSYRTCAMSRRRCGGRAATSAQPDSRQWRICWVGCCLTRLKSFRILTCLSCVGQGFSPTSSPRGGAVPCVQLCPAYRFGLASSCPEGLQGVCCDL